MQEVTLVLTDPKPHDIHEFFEANQDSGFKKHLFNRIGLTIEEAQKSLTYVINRKNISGFLDYVFIKISWNVGTDDLFNSSNSNLIGFISLNNATEEEFRITGFRTLLSFGIKKNYENQNLMVKALNMKIRRYTQQGVNFVASFVNSENLGKTL